MLSGNSVGATHYSDRHWTGPMWYEETRIIRCRRCENFVWVRDMEEFASMPKTAAERFKSWMTNWTAFLPKTKPLTLEETAEALASHVAKDKEEERYLRFSLWWLFNHRIRCALFWCKKPTETDLFKTPEEKDLWNENLSLLFDLMDASVENERLTQAEICRERGEFERAIDILNEMSAKNPTFDLRSLRQRCQELDPFVYAISTSKTFFSCIGFYIGIIVYITVGFWAAVTTFRFFGWLLSR